MSFHSPHPTPRPLPPRPEMHVLLSLNDRSYLVLRSSVMGILSSCAHSPCPTPAPTGAKRTLSASSSQAPHGPEPGSQPLKTRTLSGMASKTTTTTTPKRVAHSPSLQVGPSGLVCWGGPYSWGPACAGPSLIFCFGTPLAEWLGLCCAPSCLGFTGRMAGVARRCQGPCSTTPLGGASALADCCCGHQGYGSWGTVQESPLALALSSPVPGAVCILRGCGPSSLTCCPPPSPFPLESEEAHYPEGVRGQGPHGHPPALSQPVHRGVPPLLPVQPGGH